MNEQNNTSKKIRRIILIILAIMALLALVSYFISTKSDSSDTYQTDNYSSVDAYENMIFSISKSTDSGEITISANHGYRDGTISYLIGKGIDPTNYKITFTDYTNPFEAYDE